MDLKRVIPVEAGRLRMLDGLRFVAAFAVVVYHFTARTNPAWGAETYDVFPVVGRFTVFGSMGVELFFVISGFVIMLSAQGKSVRDFAISRAIRLYPAFWAGVLLTGALLWATGFQTPSGSWAALNVRGLLMNLTMVQSAWGVSNADGVYWTLWIELLFYAMVAVLLATGGVSRSRMLFLALGWPLVATLLNGMGFPGVGAFLQPQYAPYFGVGITLFLIYRDGWRFSVVLALAADSIFALWEAGSFMPGWIRNWTPLAPTSTQTTATAVLIICSVGAIAVIPRLRRIDWRWLSVLGALTYPLYIIHDIWGWWLISQVRKFLPVWPTLIVSLLLVVAMAAGIHYLVERPVAKLMRRWARRDRQLTDGERAPLALPVLRARNSPSRVVASPAGSMPMIERRTSVESSV